MPNCEPDPLTASSMDDAGSTSSPSDQGASSGADDVLVESGAGAPKSGKDPRKVARKYDWLLSPLHC